MARALSDKRNLRECHRALKVVLHLCRARRIISFHCDVAAVQKVSNFDQPQLNLVLFPMNFDLARRE